MPTFGYSPWDSDDDDDDVWFGCFRAAIVGIRYYRGRVNNHEMVSLTREPRNPYDCNAVRVDNVYGVQVGHIKREQAKAVAHVVDGNLARVEGTVPFGMNNKFSLPCDVHFYGKEEDRHNVTAMMASSGYNLVSTVRGNSFGLGGSSFGSQLEGPGGYLPKATKIPSSMMKQQLDNLFDDITENDKTVTVEPSEAIKSSMYFHQKQALAWMINCENTTELPPFWEETIPGKEFFNKVTNFTTTKRPKSIKGGILADDMGLGKTLEIIALIVSNFKNGKPLVTVNKKKPITLKGDRRYSTVQSKASKSTSKLASSQLSNVDQTQFTQISDFPATQALPLLPSLPDLPVAESVPQLETLINMEVADTVEIESTPAEDDKKPLSTIIPPNTIQETSKEPVKQRKSKRNAGKKIKYNFEDDLVDGEEGEENMAVKPKKRRETDCTEYIPDNDDQALEIESSVCEDSQQSFRKKQKRAKSTRTKTKAPLKPFSSFVDVEYIPQFSGEQEEEITTFECKKTKAAGTRATLIICPLSVLSNWQDQVEAHIYAGALDVYLYHGSDRIKDCNELAQKDIVLTTYQTLGSEYAKGTSPLLSTEWFRVVLDEGHCIRNPSALMSKGAHELKADRRWVVSGTPMQNSMKDLWSIICFLKLNPFTDRQWWRRAMERPIAQGEKEGLKRVQLLMRKIAMRRTKDQKIDGKPLVDLPERTIYLQQVEMTREERDIYQAVENQGRVTIGKYVQAGTMLRNYTQVLVILTRLRQLCCHPKLCSDAIEAAAKGLENATPQELKNKLLAIMNMMLNSGVEEECPVCLEVLGLPVITYCAHIFCRKCIENVIATDINRPPRCPMCRRDIALEELVEPSSEEQDRPVKDGGWVSSSKVDALMMALAKQRQQDPSQKCLIVSQFLSFLNMIQVPLTTAGYKFVTLDGSMTAKKRAAAIRSFSDSSPDSPTVMLLSLKAGGQGINLTAATRIYLMDPAWNPASEDQCFDRCHRLGQTKDVQVMKFVMKDSVEERMLELQTRKKDLIAGAFTKKMTAEEKRQQRADDLQSLLLI